MKQVEFCDVRPKEPQTQTHALLDNIDKIIIYECNHIRPTGLWYVLWTDNNHGMHMELCGALFKI